MKFFTKQEGLAVFIILLVIAGVSFNNFKISIRRARDNQRRNDLGALYSALIRYQSDFGIFPASSEDGKILACIAPGTVIPKDPEEKIDYIPCDWGNDAFRDVTDLSYPPYLEILPQDPSNQKGYAYRYVSSGKRFQLYASFEGRDEAEFDPIIEQMGLSCGSKVCNMGKAYSNTPLEKSLQEYENELIQSQKS